MLNCIAASGMPKQFGYKNVAYGKIHHQYISIKSASVDIWALNQYYKLLGEVRYGK